MFLCKIFNSSFVNSFYYSNTGIGLEIIGPLTFHSGFVVKIEEIILDPLGFAESGRMANDYVRMDQIHGNGGTKQLWISFGISG